MNGFGAPRAQQGQPSELLTFLPKNSGRPLMGWNTLPPPPGLHSSPQFSQVLESKARSYPVPQNFGDEARGPPRSVVILPSCDKSCSLRSQVATGGHSSRHAEQVTKLQTGPHRWSVPLCLVSPLPGGDLLPTSVPSSPFVYYKLSWWDRPVPRVFPLFTCSRGKGWGCSLLLPCSTLRQLGYCSLCFQPILPPALG